MNYKSIYWSVALKNCVCIICWTALAVYFGKWWLALFSLLCFSNITWKKV